MTFVPIMLSVWGFTVLILAIMLVYRARLTRDEEDQIFLDDSFDHEKSAQAAIVAKVEKVQPMVRGTEIVAGVATLFVIGYFVLDMVNHLR
jgi:hypothetical protein